MQKTGIANLPLHYGKAPKWLFQRMVELSAKISEIIIYEYSQEEFLKRLSDPYWFQAFSCVLGYDWHSSGTTTVTCGALKEALKKENLGVAVCGGKGRISRKTPDEIILNAENFSLSTEKINKLKYASKMAAKVDNCCIQDGYQLYHHSFFFDEKGNWAVVQQGMNDNFARRYHWLSSDLGSFVNEPHTAICCERKEKDVLDMTAKNSEEARKISVDLVNENPEKLLKFSGKQKTLSCYEELTMPRHHEIYRIDLKKQDIEALKKAYEIQPKNYEELVSLQGIGAKRIRALALISELIYGAKPSWQDPVKFSFSHGGKDGYPFPVKRKIYDKSISTLKEAIEQAKIGNKEKLYAIKRLNEFLHC
ncbi:MAG: DUF763 domain-containing protein [Candidatus Altiarchaeota archaeon]